MHAKVKSTFLNIYNTEADGIFRFCFLRTSQREVATDLVQETFMRLWDNMRRHKEIMNHRAFIYTVARNLIIDWYRKKKPQSLESMTEDGEIDEAIPLPDNARGEAELGAEGRFLLDKIKELNPSYREVVHLRYVEGLLPSEIALMLDDSVNAVSVRIHRGIEKLREMTGYDDL